jgi:hypothetical protein
VQGVPLNDMDAADLGALFRTLDQQHLRESQDGAHGRANLVTHIRQELALGPIGGLGVEPGSCQFIGEVLALGDVANIALNYVLPALPIDVADELDGNMPAVFVLQWKILIADMAELLQLCHRPLGYFGILKDADLPQLFSQEVFFGITKQTDHEGIDFQYLGGDSIKNKDAVVRRLKQPSVADFGNLQILFRLPSIA